MFQSNNMVLRPAPRYALATTNNCQYNAPVKVDMSLSVLASDRKKSDRQSKEQKVVRLQK